MHFIPIVTAAALSLAGTTHAWAQAADGTWIANSVQYNIGGTVVDEACTRMNTNTILENVDCRYWLNAQGDIRAGRCVASVDFQGHNFVTCNV